MLKRVLVTGGAGFIGSHLVDRLLLDGYAAVVIDNESTGFRTNVNPAATYIRGDVTNLAELDRAFEAGIDAVFHIAGQASNIRSFGEPEQDLRVNVNGTINVVKKCLEYRVGRLLYASSMTVYGEPERIPTPETEACLPISYYGISKYAAERYVHATAGRPDLDFDLAVTSFRMFNVYGERQSLSNPYQGVGAIFIGNVLRNQPIIIHSDGEQARDFVHVSDVVDAWMRALQSPLAFGNVFNVGTGEPHSINELKDLMLAALGCSHADYPVKYEPVRPGDLRRVAADIGRLRACLQWEPKVPFHVGMARTIDWAIEGSRAGRTEQV